MMSTINGTGRMDERALSAWGRPRALLTVLALACASEPDKPDPPEVETDTVPVDTLPVDTDVQPDVEQIDGVEAVRLSTREAQVGTRLMWPDPLVIEVAIPKGRVIEPLGLRPEGRSLPDGADGLALMQLAFPVHHDAQVDEKRTAGTIGVLDAPKICPLEGECPFRVNAEGRWQAWRLRQVGGEETVTPLDIAVGRLDRVGWSHDDEPRELDPLPSVLSVWLPLDSPPLDGFDRVVFSYVGTLPRRSDTWLPEPLDGWKVRVRIRSDEAPCPTEEPRCWEVVSPDEVQSLRLTPKHATHARLIAPLDVEVDEPFQVRVVMLDQHGNPSPVTDEVVVVDGAGDPVGTIPLQDAWAGETTLTVDTAGSLSLQASSGLDVIGLRQWLMVHGQGAMTAVRKVGDVHAHSGITGERSFVPTWTGGDHRGDFTHAVGSLSYMHQVAGFDFGALSEHAVSYEGYQLPTGVDATVFGPGGVCELRTDEAYDQPDWWGPSQDIARRYGEEHPDFLTFSAYEWHGRWQTDTENARLHRVVVFRDQEGDLPMLPGRTVARPPQCLFRFLESAGRTPSDTLILAHMMKDDVANVDWELSYAPRAPWDELVSPDATYRWQRGVEMFSARNGQIFGNVHGGKVLHTFEGNVDPTGQTWAIRLGWRDLGAVIGVVGGSDAHSQMPGADELPARLGAPREHRHDPGGVSFVLAEPEVPLRDGVFDGIARRATYATSGPRAWLDFHVEHPERAEMGSEITEDACSVEAKVRLMVGRTIRELQLWGVQVGTDSPYRLLNDGQLYPEEDVRLDHTIVNPAEDGEETWLYYVRAHLGPNVDGTVNAADHQDAVWSSPIWIRWSPGTCP